MEDPDFRTVRQRQFPLANPTMRRRGSRRKTRSKTRMRSRRVSSRAKYRDSRPIRPTRAFPAASPISPDVEGYSALRLSSTVNCRTSHGYSGKSVQWIDAAAGGAAAGGRIAVRKHQPPLAEGLREPYRR